MIVGKMFRPRNHHFLRLFGNLNQSVRFNSNSNDPLNRRTATWIILNAKDQCNQTFDSLAKELNVNKVWLTSAILGQHPIDEQTSKKLIQTLKIDSIEIDRIVKALGRSPDYRGCDYNPASNQDPTIRRLNELVDVYGETFKTLIREEFGDGIMSAIDCTIDFEKQINKNNEARIIIKIDGKYLQYKH